jgi:hypothetical protein
MQRPAAASCPRPTAPACWFRTPRCALQPSWSVHVCAYVALPKSYGSGAVFGVMCPHTQLWQSTVAGAVARLVAEAGVDGVYIDQVRR